MGFIIFLIFVVFIVGFIVINVKISNLKYRAGQQILRDTGISSADINAGISESFERKALQRFLSENPEYTEDSIKELLKQYTFQIFNFPLISVIIFHYFQNFHNRNPKLFQAASQSKLAEYPRHRRIERLYNLNNIQ